MHSNEHTIIVRMFPWKSRSASTNAMALHGMCDRPCLSCEVESRGWIESLFCDEHFGKYAIALVGTKTDLRSSDNACAESFEEMARIARELRVPYIETSALDDVNVDFAFRQCMYEYWFQTTVTREDRVAY